MTPLPNDPRLASPAVGGVDPAQPARRPDPGSTPAGAPARAGGPAFADVLRRETSQVKFSQHALQRVERRGIELDAPTLDRLSNGVARAAQKGARESVVFVDGTAFVVSVKNSTVITAVDREHMREHVFTNIDSAVIA
jgi:flagellar operon protein